MEQLLEPRQIMAVECIFGELLQGTRNRQEREVVLGFWRNLPKAGVSSEETWIRAGILSAEQRLSRKGVGIIDAVILLVAEDQGALLWTLDKKLLKVIRKEQLFRL
jgi:hypothetical protein